MFDESTPLNDLFDPSGIEQWRLQAEADLRGRPIESLGSKTDDDVAIRPLYAREDSVTLAVPPRPDCPLQRRALIDDAEADAVAARVREEVDAGAHVGQLVMAAPGRQHGLEVDASRWPELLASVADVPLVLDALEGALDHARVWLEIIKGREAPICLGFDPFAIAARCGEISSIDSLLADAASLATDSVEFADRLAAIRIDTAFASNAGATMGQSLGILVANMVEILRACENAGLDLERAHERLEFTFRVDTHFFESMAALRAARLLHHRVLDVCSVTKKAPMFLFSRPASRIATQRDPWVNILRQTATSFAAITGGADAITCDPFDNGLSNKGTLGRRIARNTPIILEEESHLRAVADPAAGSWFLDNLTRDLAEEGWKFFQKIEAQGGAAMALKSGWLLDQVNESHESRRDHLAKRKVAICGVSEYPNLEEKLPAPVAKRASDAAYDAWPVRRLADEFEKLRTAADRYEIAVGQAPWVFLANLGSVAQHTARKAWVSNLLGVGGVRVAATESSTEVDAQLSAFADSACRVAILCSSDDLYAEHAQILASAFTKAGAYEVWLAGKPGDSESELRAAGVDRFLHLGIDTLEALEHLHRVLEVSR